MQVVADPRQATTTTTAWQARSHGQPILIQVVIPDFGNDVIQYLTARFIFHSARVPKSVVVGHEVDMRNCTGKHLQWCPRTLGAICRVEHVSSPAGFDQRLVTTQHNHLAIQHQAGWFPFPYRHVLQSSPVKLMLWFYHYFYPIGHLAEIVDP